MDKEKANHLRAPGGASLLRRYAQECRALAYECVEGTAPPFITESFEEPYGRCAIGWVLHRLDPSSTARETFWRLYDILSSKGCHVNPTARTQAPDAAVIDANNRWPENERHAVVVFPLLWLADAVEDLAARKSRPQKDLP